MQKSSVNNSKNRQNQHLPKDHNSKYPGSSRWKTIAATSLTIFVLIGFVIGVWRWEAANAAKPNVYTYTVTITDRGFEPKTLKSSTGSSVKIHLINKGTKEHNFVLPAYFIFSPNLHAGQSTDLEFSPDKSGTFPYYSDAPGSQEPGLSGHLLVQ